MVTFAKISAALKGNTNAAGKHIMSGVKSARKVVGKSIIKASRGVAQNALKPLGAGLGAAVKLDSKRKHVLSSKNRRTNKVIGKVQRGVIKVGAKASGTAIKSAVKLERIGQKVKG